jgi:biopolymer transport protein ExbB
MIDAGAAGVRLAAPLTGVALALRLHSGNFDFARARDHGSDLRVVAGDDRTPLAFAIERYDALDELALLWVELPRVEAGGAPLQLYVYAGNPKAAAGAAALAAGAATGGATVFRLDQPDGRDAAGRLRASAPFVPETHALLAGGARLAGLPIVWPANEALAAPAEQPLTWSLWVKPDANASGTLLQQGALVLALREGKLVAQAGEQALAAAAPPAGRWSHVALVFGGAATAAGHAELRVDGDHFVLEADALCEIHAPSDPSVHIDGNGELVLARLQA